MKTFLLTISIFFTICNSLSAFSPGWPLKLKPTLSATFMEYRGNHFHAGIDIKTRRKTGFPVYAPFDGYVDFLHVDETGYGNMMEISDGAGHKARFGHLSTFNGIYKLDKNILNYRKNHYHRYPVNLWFTKNKFPFKKGEIIAKTGESGAGPAHLHYELWKNNFLINPLKFYASKFKDRTPPTIKSIIIIPLTYDSKIGGICEETILPLIKNRKLTICGSGKFLLYINCFDRMDKVINRLGVNKIEVKINDKKYLTYILNELNKENSHKTSQIFNREMSNLSNCDYVYQITGIKIKNSKNIRFSNRKKYIEIDGDKKIRLKVFDYNGNVTEREILFKFCNKKIGKLKYRIDGKIIKIKNNISGKIILNKNKRNMEIFDYKKIGKWKKIKRKKRRKSITFLGNDGMFSKTYPIRKLPVKFINYDFKFFENYFILYITADGFDDLKLKKPILKDFDRVSENRYILSLPFNILKKGKNIFKVTGIDGKIKKSYKLEFNTLINGKKLISDDKKFSISLKNSISLKRPIILFQRRSKKSSIFSPKIKESYCIRPRKFSFKGGILIKLICNKRVDKNSTIGRINGYLSFLKLKKRDKSIFESKSYGGGDFSIYEDNFTPVLRGKRNYFFKKICGEKLIYFKLLEKGSGIKRDNIKLKFDNKSRDFGYIRQDRKIEIPIYEWDSTGTHKYKLTVKDNSGNIRVVEGKIVISRKSSQSSDFPKSKIK